MKRTAKDAALYFKHNPGYHRAFQQMRTKWQSYGSARGVVILKTATEIERNAMRQFFGSYFDDQDIRFSLKSFEQALQDTPFAGITLKNLLEAYFGEEQSSSKDKRSRAKEALELFFDQLAEAIPNQSSWAASWLSQMRQEKSWGYQLIVGAYRKDRNVAFGYGQTVVSALNVLEDYQEKNQLAQTQKEAQQTPLRIAVCASLACGRPHALDYQFIEGKLFAQALSCLFNQTLNNAEERMELYYQAGLVADTLSSFTITRGVIFLETSSKEHPGYEILRKRNDICHMSLHTISMLSGATTINKRVYIVENQMVYSQLCDLLPRSQNAIICTSGQVRTASLILIDLLVKSGCQIWYSGDYDPEGLLIADKLIRRGKGQVHLWHYSVEKYLQSESSHEISTERLKMNERLDDPILKEIGNVMNQRRVAVYQEEFLPSLQYDIEHCLPPIPNVL